MKTLHPESSPTLMFSLPLTKAVGRMEWYETQTRLYGIDSCGTVFVFKPPYTSPRHRALRLPGHYAAWRLLRFLAGARGRV